MRALVAGLLIGWQTFGALVSVVVVGKPRKTITGGIAAAGVIISALVVAGIYWLWAS